MMKLEHKRVDIVRVTLVCTVIFLAVFLIAFQNRRVKLGTYICLRKLSRERIEPLNQLALNRINMIGREHDPGLLDIFRSLLKSGDPELKTAAVEILGEYRDEESIADLIYISKNDDSIACYCALWSLGKIGTSEATDFLINTAKNGKSETQRKEAIRSLSHINNARVANTFIKCIDDKSEDVRYEAIKELGNLRYRASSDFIIQRLNDESSLVRVASVKALIKIGEPKAIIPLMRYIEREDKKNNDIRKMAILGLIEINPHNDEIMMFLDRLSRDEDSEIRNTAAETLKKINNKSVK